MVTSQQYDPQFARYYSLAPQEQQTLPTASAPPDDQSQSSTVLLQDVNLELPSGIPYGLSALIKQKEYAVHNAVNNWVNSVVTASENGYYWCILCNNWFAGNNLNQRDASKYHVAFTHDKELQNLVQRVPEDFWITQTRYATTDAPFPVGITLKSVIGNARPGFLIIIHGGITWYSSEIAANGFTDINQQLGFPDFKKSEEIIIIWQECQSDVAVQMKINYSDMLQGDIQRQIPLPNSAPITVGFSLKATKLPEMEKQLRSLTEQVESIIQDLKIEDEEQKEMQKRIAASEAILKSEQKIKEEYESTLAQVRQLEQKLHTGENILQLL